MERQKSSIDRAGELRKELLKLKDEEVGKIEKGEADPDLIALRSEQIGGLSVEELNMLNSLLALEGGFTHGYLFGKDEIISIKKALKKFDGALVRRKDHMLAEEMKKNPGEVLKKGNKLMLSDKAMRAFEQAFNNEDYVALYHRWIKHRFEKFFRDHPEYNYEAEEAGAAK